MFTYTTGLNKLRRLKKRIKLIPGGTSAGKTIAVLAILIDKAARTPLLEVSVVAESVPHLRRGALKDFKKIMKQTGRWREAGFHGTNLVYTFANGATIEFFGADSEGKVLGARRHVLYLNECNHIPFSVYHQLAARTSGDIWLDYNPAFEFWADTEFEGADNVDTLTLTYLDNEARPANVDEDMAEALRKSETSAYWANWYRVYGQGLRGKLEGVIFDDWSVIDILPKGARLVGRGLDFGFTNDPTAVVACYLSDGVPVFDEEVYETGLTNPELAKLLKAQGVRRADYIVADSADPKSIAELNSSGLSVVPVVKGADSVVFGLDILASRPFKVTKRSVNLLRELRRYSWDKDKAGNNLNRPIDAFNHAIDAVRYLAMSKLARQAKPVRAPRVAN